MSEEDREKARKAAIREATKQVENGGPLLRPATEGRGIVQYRRAQAPTPLSRVSARSRSAQQD